MPSVWLCWCWGTCISLHPKLYWKLDFVPIMEFLNYESQFLWKQPNNNFFSENHLLFSEVVASECTNSICCITIKTRSLAEIKDIFLHFCFCVLLGARLARVSTSQKFSFSLSYFRNWNNADNAVVIFVVVSCTAKPKFHSIKWLVKYKKKLGLPSAPQCITAMPLQQYDGLFSSFFIATQKGLL